MTGTRSQFRPVVLCALLAAVLCLPASAGTARELQFDVQCADAAWAAEARAVLMQTSNAFHEAFAKAGFDLRPTGDPLLCFGFADRTAFERYALRADGVDMSWSDGYYSARTNRIALYYGSPTDSYDRDPMPTSEQTMPVEGHGHWRMKLSHEAAHQLAFNCGLQARGVMYPLWASEGLAAWFESCVSGPWALDADNPDRRADLADVTDRGALLPLKQLLTMTRVPSRAEAISDIYAQSWAWFRFAITQEPQALQRYFAALASLRRGTRDRVVLEREIEAAFGPIAALELRWQRYVADLTKHAD